MANNHDKIFAQQRLNAGAIQRAREAINQIGRALPCKVTAINGSLVTVGFEVDSSPWTLPQITIPKAESPWIRMPTQIGDTGITVPADTFIGNISGTATSLPDVKVQPANLSALVFVPVSNANSPSPDNNAAVCQGPNGFIGQTTSGTASSVVTDTTGTTITFGTTSLKIDATGVTITVGGISYTFSNTAATFNGIDFGTHYHYVPAAPGNSDGPL